MFQGDKSVIKTNGEQTEYCTEYFKRSPFFFSLRHASQEFWFIKTIHLYIYIAYQIMGISSLRKKHITGWTEKIGPSSVHY